MTNLSYEGLMALPPRDLFSFLFEGEFADEVPKEIITVDDMREASKLALKLSGQFSYLMALLSYAKITTREAERKKSENKEAYQDMVDRKEMIANAVESVKQRYTGLSRAVTIKQECNRELGMKVAG